MNIEKILKIEFTPPRVLTSLVVISGVSWSLLASAAAPPLSQVAEKYISCTKPILQEHAPYRSEGRSGFGIVVQGEPYYFALSDRVLVTFDSVKHSGTVAHLKLDRPMPTEFSEQASWRERMLQDVADRSGVPLERTAPHAGITLLTINKPRLTGKSAGLSMLIDHKRDVMVEWAWNILDRYRDPNDVKTLQAEIWKQLIPCLG